MNMSYLMNKELGQAILNYLGTQPYQQVAGLVQGMQQMGEISEEDLQTFLASKDIPQLPEPRDAD